MRPMPFLRILLLTVTSFPSIRGYILGPGCPAYARDIYEALNEFITSATAPSNSLNRQNNEVED